MFFVLRFSCFRVCLLLPCGQLASWLLLVMLAGLLALVGDVYCIFVTFPCGILGQVLAVLFVSFPDLSRLSYSKIKMFPVLSIYFSVQAGIESQCRFAGGPTDGYWITYSFDNISSKLRSLLNQAYRCVASHLLVWIHTLARGRIRGF